MSSAFETVLEQALKLPAEQRGDLAAQLLQSLDSVAGDEVAGPEWVAVWSAEIDRRVRELREGEVELIDGDHVLDELRAIAERV